MLLRVDTQTKIAYRQRGVRLKEFALDERELQDILFRSLKNRDSDHLKEL